MMIDLGASKLLDPGERLTWSGRPDAIRYAFKKSIATFLFGLFFFGFSIFWISGAAKQSGLMFALFGVPFVIVGLGLVLSPIWHFLRSRQAIYVLTDRRAVVDIAGWFPRRLSVPLGQIRFVEAKLSTNGCGDILFRETGRTDGEGGWTTSRDGFVAVSSADQVDRLLRAAIAKSLGPGSPGSGGT
jgi:hypothetical protein